MIKLQQEPSGETNQNTDLLYYPTFSVFNNKITRHSTKQNPSMVENIQQRLSTGTIPKQITQ